MVSNEIEEKLFPIINKCEKLIKKEIRNSLLKNVNETLVLNAIREIIQTHYYDKFPKEIQTIDKQEYANSLWYSSMVWYDKSYRAFKIKTDLIIALLGFRYKNAFEILEDKETIKNYDVIKYIHEVEDVMFDLARDLLSTPYYIEDYRKPISLRQKLICDINMIKQQEMLNEVLKSGSDLYRISQHKGSSLRCKAFQGKVVSMSLKSVDFTYFTGHYTIENEKIYSFNDIISKVDMYGYQNNIIVGFNCKHRLFVWKPNMKEEDYTDDVDEDTIKVNEIARKLESKIVMFRMASTTCITNDKKLEYKQIVKEMIDKYFSFCKKHKIQAKWYKIKV